MKQGYPSCSLLRDTRGLAATEFALLAPILVLLFIGVVELSNLLMADAKLRAVSSSVADLLTQDGDGEVAAGDINILNVAAAQIMAPQPVTGARLRFTVTVYQISSAAGNPVSVRWRRTFVPPATPTATGTGACSGAGLPVSLKAPTLNDVVKVEASYTWTPRFLTLFNTGMTLRTVSYNMPRYSLSLPLAPSVTPSGC